MLSNHGACRGLTAAAVPLLLLLLVPCVPAAWHECNSQGVFPGLYGSAALANLTAFRTSLLSKVHTSFNPDADFPKGFGRFDPVSPILNCPPHRPASPYYRWRFCDMGRLPSCVVYSVGPVQQDYAFEKDVIAFTKCEVHTLDCTTEGKSIDKKRHKHHKLCIGEGKPDHKSWQEIVKQLGHHTRGIEALKIDMEGPDAAVFAQLKHNTLLPRQLAAELHIRPPPPEATALPPEAARSPAQLALIFAHLAALGYGATSRVDNGGGQPGCCSQFAWLHVEKVWAYGPARAAHSRPGSKQSSGGSAALVAEEGEQEEGPPRAKRLVVSMASFPGRAEFGAPTVYSIMHGTRKPDALYFWVTVNVSRFDSNDKEVNSETQIPGDAKMLEKQFPGVVKVLPARKDFGPATKLLPTLEVETDPETIIITIDDDTYYSTTTVAELEEEMLRRPGYVVVRSCENTYWDAKKNPPRKGWREWKLSEGVCKGFITAYASAAYRRGYLDDLVFDQDRAPKGCLHHDDIWFSAHLWLRNVPIWVLNHVGRSWPPMYHRPKNRMSISMHPQAEERAQECLDYFHWMNDEARRKELMGNHTEYVP